MKSTVTKKVFTAHLVAAILLSACTPSVQPWQRSDLVGYRYELKDRKTFQQFSFHEDGYVLVGLGQKDGAVAAPIFYWELTTNGTLIIKDHPQQIEFIFSKISLNADKATVIGSGKKQVWLRSKNQDRVSSPGFATFAAFCEKSDSRFCFGPLVVRHFTALLLRIPSRLSKRHARRLKNGLISEQFKRSAQASVLVFTTYPLRHEQDLTASPRRFHAFQATKPLR